MIELNSIFVILMIEAFLGFVLLVSGILFLSKKKNASEHIAAHALIDKLEDIENIKTKNLDEMISEYCNIDVDLKEGILSEISYSEQVLYQQIIQMFLNRDVELLKDMDEYIENLSEPYCKVIRNSSISAEDSEKLEAAENKIDRLIQESKSLEQQLKEAITTMDEISAEYTRVFSGTQTELMLENSSKKMLTIFHDAELRIRNSFKSIKVEGL